MGLFYTECVHGTPGIFISVDRSFHIKCKECNITEEKFVQQKHSVIIEEFGEPGSKYGYLLSQVKSVLTEEEFSRFFDIMFVQNNFTMYYSLEFEPIIPSDFLGDYLNESGVFSPKD